MVQQARASKWEEAACPWATGDWKANGRFGGVAQERIQLNEDSVWSGGPQDADNPAGSELSLPKIRALPFCGKVCRSSGAHGSDAGLQTQYARIIRRLSDARRSAFDFR